MASWKSRSRARCDNAKPEREKVFSVRRRLSEEEEVPLDIPVGREEEEEEEEEEGEEEGEGGAG
jgi:hypothetical protein